MQADADPFDLQRFVDAQHGSYRQALDEIHDGRKQTHWMWFVFPQLRGLGTSSMSQKYAISGPAEARAYLGHPLLGPRLMACFEAVLAAPESAGAMFGSPDDSKLRSCATLFAAIAPAEPVFRELLVRKFGGDPDQRTLQLLGT